MAQKIHVFKLAAEFNMANEQMVAKIQEFGFPVKNYMSSLEDESVQQIRRLIQRERESSTVEEQIRPTVVRRRTAAVAPPKPAKTRPPELSDDDRQKMAEEEAIVVARQKARQVEQPVTKEVVAPAAAVVVAPAVAPTPVVEKSEKVDAATPAPTATASSDAVVAPPRKPPEPIRTLNKDRVIVPVHRPQVREYEGSTRPAPRGAPRPEYRPDSRPDSRPVSRPVSRPEASSYRDRSAPADPSVYEDMTLQALAAAVSNDGADPRGGSLRPSSEAPIIRRQITPGSDTRYGKGTAPRKRELESREIAPSRRAAAAVGGAAAASGPARKRRMVPGTKGKKTEITTPKAIKRVIRIEGQVTLQELAKRMSVKSTELLMKLMALGVAGININSTLDLDTSKIVAEEFGYEVESNVVEEVDMLAGTRAEETDEEKTHRVTRAPIVTMMGHVDHGKTSLLDYIRKANVADGEAGGITQHIGAYRVKTPIGEVAFIDTPGHAAFTAMRARGANATDIVVLVCAADDGVMPQTIEAIAHARASGCPIIVAINKCDLPGADPLRAKRMLMEHSLVPEELGGETIMVEVSAKTGAGVEQLLEMISVQAEVMELNANPKRPGAGMVLEAYLDKGRGPVANILVKEGTLRVGDIVVAGAAYGKIRAMTDERGRKTAEAGPATPVEILGLSIVPQAGDIVDVVVDMKLAEKIAASRDERTRASIAPSSRPSLESLYSQMQSGEQAELKIVLKTDVQGTMEALRDALQKASMPKVKVTVVSASCGGITESDVLLASTAGAIIIGFNVRPAGKARTIAEEQAVEIKIFSIIYEVLDAVKASMLGLLSPQKEQEVIGMAQVRDIFTIPKFGTIAGSYVTEGKVVRNGFARLIRDSVQIWEGKVSSLRRFKDDAREVAAGFECGIGLAGYNDIRVDDVIEFYLEKEVAATLN